MSTEAKGRLSTWLKKRVRYRAQPISPGGKLGKRLLFLPTGGRFEVVGESFYQDELARLTGGKRPAGHSKPVVAILFPDDDNAYDDNAVEVVVNELRVGYIPSESCSQFREYIATARERGMFLAAHGVIIGGWDRGGGDTGHFGIYLDVGLQARYSFKQVAEAKGADNVLDLSPVRSLVTVPAGRTFDVNGEARHGWDLGEILGHHREPFKDEAFFVTIETGADGSLDVVALGTTARLEAGPVSGRTIGTIPKRDHAAWRTLLEQVSTSGSYPAVVARANGYGLGEDSSEKRTPLVVTLDVAMPIS